MKWFILLMLFSGVSHALTEKQLVEKYGKKCVVNFISERTMGKLTIIFNGKLMSAQAPSLEFITINTISNDLNRIGFSAKQVDFIFTKKKKDKEEKIANDKRILAELESERQLRKKATRLAEEKQNKVRRLAEEKQKNHVFNRFDFVVCDSYKQEASRKKCFLELNGIYAKRVPKKAPLEKRLTSRYLSLPKNNRDEKHITGLEAAMYRQENSLSNKVKYSTNSRERAEAKHTLEVLRNMPKHEKDALFKRAYKEAARGVR
mgnify:CR=1 FL=1